MATKRQKIAVSSLFLAIGIFALPLVGGTNQIVLLSAVVIASYFFSVWSIFGEFSPFELVSLFAMPVILTASFEFLAFGTTEGWISRCSGGLCNFRDLAAPHR